MLNEKDVSKELTDAVSKVLSRRDAVKKVGSIAAGAALAFLGLSLPGISQQKEARACGTCCKGSCLSCTGGCEGCTGSCYDTCEGGCYQGCEGGCGDDACEQVCTASCGLTCQGCTGTCDSWCETACEGGCTGGCDTGCYGSCLGGEMG